MALWLFLLTVCSALEWWEESKAPLLDSASLRRLAGAEKYLLVEFFTPWCHYCHLMFPEFEHFYHVFQDRDSPDYREDFLIARVNAGADQIIALQNDVSGFPTILVWEPGNKEPKHRVEGYQRRSDLRRLAVHVLPDRSHRPVASPAVEPSPLPPVPPPVPPIPPPVTEADAPEAEYEIVYRDSAAAIKDDLNVTYHKLVAVLDTQKSDLNAAVSSVFEAVKELRAIEREERERDSERFEKLEARLEELHLDIKQRNRLESAQTRLNLTHMALFIAIGGVIGAALTVLSTKVGDARNTRNKV